MKPPDILSKNFDYLRVTIYFSILYKHVTSSALVTPLEGYDRTVGEGFALGYLRIIVHLRLT